jgi:tRNA 2-thiouridine synthesizing protein A
MEPVLVDARGLSCPLPLLRTRKALMMLAPGGRVRVLATDPGAEEDFAAFCRDSGHVLEAVAREDGVLRIDLVKNPSA